MRVLLLLRICLPKGERSLHLITKGVCEIKLGKIHRVSFVLQITVTTLRRSSAMAFLCLMDFFYTTGSAHTCTRKGQIIDLEKRKETTSCRWATTVKVHFFSIIIHQKLLANGPSEEPHNHNFMCSYGSTHVFGWTWRGRARHRTISISLKRSERREKKRHESCFRLSRKYCGSLFGKIDFQKFHSSGNLAFLKQTSLIRTSIKR